METKRIKIRVVTRKTADGRVFNMYRTVTKNGRLIDCKFRKDVTNVPKQDCFITCPIDKMSIQKNVDFPCLWVGQIDSIEPIGGSEDTPERKAENAAAINEMFG